MIIFVPCKIKRISHNKLLEQITIRCNTRNSQPVIENNNGAYEKLGDVSAVGLTSDFVLEKSEIS